MSNPRFSISVRSDFNDVYTYLQSLDNISLYICKLVRNDIQQKKKWPIDSESLKSLIEEIIDSKLSSLKFDNIKIRNQEISDDDRNIISQLY